MFNIILDKFMAKQQPSADTSEFKIVQNLPFPVYRLNGLQKKIFRILNCIFFSVSQPRPLPYLALTNVIASIEVHIHVDTISKKTIMYIRSTQSLATTDARSY